MAGFVSINAEMDLSGRDVDLAPDARCLPGHVELRLSRTIGLLCFAFALALMAPALMCLIAPGNGLPVSIACAMLLVGLACGAVGAHFLLLLVEWDLTTVAVTRHRRGILGRREWQEPLASYRCILARHVFRSSVLGDPADVLHMIELKHADRRDRDVCLYSSNMREGFRSKHAHYAHLFGLPAILATPFGEMTCPPDYPETAAAGATGDGAFGLAECLAEPPPRGRMATAVAGGVLTVRTRRCLSPWVFQVLSVAWMVLTSLIVTWTLGENIFWFAVFTAVLGLFLLVWARLATERIAVSACCLRYWRSFPGRREAEMSLARLEDVHITRIPGGLWWRKAVLITDGQQDLYFGGTLSSAEKEWVCRCINAAVAST